MSSQEHDRINLLEEVKKRKITIREAADLRELSERQFYRLKSSYEKEGISGIIHKSRDRPSNRGFSPSLRNKVKKDDVGGIVITHGTDQQVA